MGKKFTFKDCINNGYYNINPLDEALWGTSETELMSNNDKQQAKIDYLTDAIKVNKEILETEEEEWDEWAEKRATPLPQIRMAIKSRYRYMLKHLSSYFSIDDVEEFLNDQKKRELDNLPKMSVEAIKKYDEYLAQRAEDIKKAEEYIKKEKQQQEQELKFADVMRKYDNVPRPPPL